MTACFLAFTLPFRRPSQFPRNGLLAARIACRFANESWTPIFVRAVYHANFAEDQDIADSRVITGCLRSLDQDAETILEAVASGEAKTLLRAQTERAMNLGIFGAPSFVVIGTALRINPPESNHVNKRVHHQRA